MGDLEKKYGKNAKRAARNSDESTRFDSIRLESSVL